MMHNIWRPLCEAGSVSSFAIAPLTGHLVLTKIGHSFENENIIFKTLGFKAENKKDIFSFVQGSVLDLKNDCKLDDNLLSAAKKIERTVAWLLLIFPMSTSIRMIENLYGANDCAISPQSAIDLTCAAFGMRSGNDCLPLSLKRYALLRSFGFSAEINFGVFLPTEEMHAWVEINNHPVLEWEDTLMHFQSCLKFSNRKFR